MLRGFRHTLFLLLQVGVVVSGAIALAVQPESWLAICICVAGSVLASLFCERVASHYLRHTLGRLRRAADELSRGRQSVTLDAQPGDDFYKLVHAIHQVANRLAEGAEEEQRLQDELRRRERLAFLGELAATVAHEVNNPLDGLQNCSRILRRSLDDPQRARQMLDLIDGGLTRIGVTVRRLLTLAREHAIRPTPARIRDVIDSALLAVSDKTERQGVVVERCYETEHDHASVDVHLLEQVFVNLVLNAVDSMAEGGPLTITVRRGPAPHGDPSAGEGWVVVEVADRGSGIEPDALPHIFEPFFTTKHSGRGAGLGLPIAARIIDAHHGAIAATPREGGGAVFTVSLPGAPLHADARRVSARAASE